MKQLLILIACVGLLAGCATQRDDGAGGVGSGVQTGYGTANRMQYPPDVGGTSQPGSSTTPATVP